MKTHAMIKHETETITRTLIFFVLVISSLILSSCNDENENGADPQDNETAQLDAQEDYYQEDSEDLALAVIEEGDPNSGGKSASGDERLTCATITRTGDENAGTITIDFGDGCTDPKENVRRGSIVVEFEGRWRTPGSFWRLRFVDYFINDIGIGGTRVVTNVSESEDSTQVFTVELEDGTMTWPDGSIATRTVHRTRELERDQNNVLNRLIIYGTAEGNHRNGRGYYIEILERLIYDRECAQQGVIIPVSGIKLIKHGEREITVDYGDGTCDNIVTITNKNGRSWRYTVGPH
jgi:hypothetical protein